MRSNPPECSAMATTSVPTESGPGSEPIHDELEAQTVALRLISAILVCASVYFLSEMLVPFFAAVVLGVGLAPLGGRLQGGGGGGGGGAAPGVRLVGGGGVAG